MLFKSRNRRNRFYNRCQWIVDDLHSRIKKGEYVDENKCKELYSKADFNAFLHQLHKENADLNYRTMTPAMEWMYASRHFKYMASSERREFRMFIIAFISALAAIISAFYSGIISNKSMPADIKEPEGHYINENVNNANRYISTVPIDSTQNKIDSGDTTDYNNKQRNNYTVKQIK